MSSSDIESYSEQSTSSIDDAIQSFKLFLELITPAEFAKLLRARVKHILKTWPPQPTTINGSLPSLPSPTRSLSPSIESVRAFAAFFRTHDSPGPSPMEVSVPTSLQHLHHQLLALQTLLTFLSGPELQDIVRARLNEGGKQRALAVQGLMDIMRDASGEDILERIADKGSSSVDSPEKSVPGDRAEAEEVSESSGSTDEIVFSTSTASRHQIPAEGEIYDGKEIRPHWDTGEPPRGSVMNKSKTRSASQEPQGSVKSSSVAPTSPSTPPPPSSSTSEIPRSLSISTISNGQEMQSVSPVGGEPMLPALGSHPMSEASTSIFSKAEISSSDNESDFEMEDLSNSAEISKRDLQGSGEGEKGLMVTHFGEAVSDSSKTNSESIKLKPPLSPLTRKLPVAIDTQSITVDDSPRTPALSAAQSTHYQTEEHSSPLQSFDSDMGPRTGVSREEWNRKRIRAVLGLPPKETDATADGKDATTDIHLPPAIQTVQTVQPHSVTDRPASPSVPTVLGASERAEPNVLPNSATRLSHSSPSRLQASSSTSAQRNIRSASPSPDVSDTEEGRASPPGPMLRAVDWENKAIPSINSELELDELDDQDGSDDILPSNNVIAFQMPVNAQGTGKPPLPPAYHNTNPPFSYRHIIWDEGRVMWGDETSVPPPSLPPKRTEKNQNASGSGTQRKLFIRLPARTSVSVSASPAPSSPSHNVGSATSKDDPDYARRLKVGVSTMTRTLNVPTTTITNMANGQQQCDKAKMQSPTSAGVSPPVPPPVAPPMAPRTNARSAIPPPSLPPSHPPPHLASNPLTPTNSVMPAHAHAPHAQHHSQYPPPGPPPGSYPPGPQWFGAMVYVPFRGGPLRGHPAHPHQPPPPPHPQHQHQPQPHPLPLHHHPHAPPHMLSHAVMTPTVPPPKYQTPLTPGPSQHVGGSPIETSASGSRPIPPPGSGPIGHPPSPPVGPPEGPKRHYKRKLPGDPEPVSLPSTSREEDPNVRYTDDVGVKESSLVKRRCYNCRSAEAPSWRKSKLNNGKILCNKCGIYESTHMTARPLKTRPRRSNGDSSSPGKKRKKFKKGFSMDLGP